MIRDAEGSDDGLYRYSLTRSWGDGLERVCWVMLNPSTADHETDDPTIRRVVDFSMRLGFDSCEVVNLWAWRATSPAELAKALDPRGPDNFEAIATAMARSSLAIWRGAPTWR